MKILYLQTELEEVYNDPDFLVALESHLTYLRSSPSLRVVTVSIHQNHKYEGDLYGLLDDLNVEKKYHYIVMRVNGMVSSADYDGTRENLFIPDFTEVNLLKNILQTAYVG
jgi:hypothetical protein